MLLFARLLPGVIAAAAFVVVGPAAPAAAASGPAGPDVSSHQHPNGAGINWGKVAGTGARLGFVKATEGHTYTNPYFASDYQALADNHMVRGAYHFARPAGGRPNARRQARYFVSVAGSLSTPGELPAVLDLEQTGGLGPNALITWTHAWVNTVKNLTGRLPMIYTYPSFWKNAMGNTTAFHRDPLWIATWGPAPEIVGGWTTYKFWQYTDKATVAGISTRVDMSVFNGSWDRLKVFSRLVTKPQAPATLTATPKSTNVNVSWTPPTSGDAPDSYTISVDGTATKSVSSSVLSYSLAGLTPGTHTVDVAGKNIAGTGPATTVQALAVTQPTAPASLSLAVTHTSETATWTAPSNDGGQLWGYKVSVDGAAPVKLGPTATSYTADNLAEGPHTWSVAAYNTAGTGDPATGTATVIVKPTAPTQLQASVTDQKVTVSWSPPVDDGYELLGYRIRIDGGSPVTVGPNTASYTTDPLTPGSHTLAVRAYNSEGAGPKVSTSVLVVVPPGSPTSLAASTGAGSVTVTWAQPTSIGGQLSGYQVWVDGGDPVVLAPNVTQYTASGLTEGNHRVEVAAYNTAGTSPPVSTTQTVEVAPSRPTSMTARDRPHRVVLTWGAPTDPGGTLKGYRVWVDGKHVANLAADAGRYVARGLAPGRHRFAVAAFNAAATGLKAARRATVLPQPSLTLSAVRHRVHSGNRVLLYGGTEKRWAGEWVQFQELTPSGWVVVAHRKIHSDGTYRLRFTAGSAGHFHYRVHIRRSTAHYGAVSPWTWLRIL